MKLNKIGIVSLGSIGRKHVRLLHELYPNIDGSLV